MDTRRRRNGCAAEAAAVKCGEDGAEWPQARQGRAKDSGLQRDRAESDRNIRDGQRRRNICSQQRRVAYVARAKALDNTGAGESMGTSDCGAANRSLVAMAVGPDVSMIAEAGKGSGTTGSASGRLLVLPATGRAANARYRPQADTA